MKTGKNVYYDTFECRKIFDYYNKNPELMLIKLKDYIEKYPYDYSIKLDYVATLIRLSYLNEAIEEMLYFEEKYFSDKDISQYEEKIDLIQKKYILVKLQLLFYEKKYNKWIKKYNQNIKLLANDQISYLASLYVKKQLNFLNMEKQSDKKYLVGQIIDYSFDDFKEHLKHHIYTEEELSEDEYTEEEIKEHSIFNQDFPLDKVIEELRIILPNKNRMNSFFENEYIFKFDCNGHSHNKITDYFKVVTFNNTNDIITMYPTIYGKNSPHIDLNYLSEKPKVKTLSQIEKFNKKYNR